MLCTDLFYMLTRTLLARLASVTSPRVQAAKGEQASWGHLHVRSPPSLTDGIRQWYPPPRASTNRPHSHLCVTRNSQWRPLWRPATGYEYARYSRFGLCADLSLRKEAPTNSGKCRCLGIP